MNKTQLICFVAGLLVFGVVISVLSGLNHRKPYVLGQTQTIGRDLIAQTNSSRVVRMGPALKRQLAGLLKSKTHVDAALMGDEAPPIGDGKACSRLILKNERGESLGIRLMPADKPDRFHIVGFWTPSDATSGVPFGR